VARASSEDVIVLGARRRTRLEAIVARATAPQRLVLRAKIVLAAWQRETTARIAGDLGICVDTARKWRGRFVREGICSRTASTSAPGWGTTIATGTCSSLPGVLARRLRRSRRCLGS
jgi:hypothetical protein